MHFSLDDWLLYTHLLFLAVAVVGIVRADHQAFAWLRGKQDSIDARHAHTTHWIVSVGLGGLIITGLFLFWPMREYLLHQPLFLLKLAFVAALLINSFYIEILMPLAQAPYAMLPRGRKVELMVSGAISTGSWLGTVVVAYILFGWPF